MRAFALASLIARPAPMTAPAVPLLPHLALPPAAAPLLVAPSLSPALPRLVLPPVLPEGRAYSAVAEPAAGDAAFLKSLRRDPPKVVVTDYDNTLTERGPDGLSRPPSEEVVAALAALLERGTKVVLASSRYYEAPGAPFPMDLASFIARLPAVARRNLLVSGGVGSELVAFDEAGEPVRLWSAGWGEGEEAALRAAALSSLESVGAPESQLVLMPGQLIVRLPTGDGRGPALAEALRLRLAAAGYGYRVLQNREFVYFSRSDKGEGLRGAFAALGGVRPGEVLLLGDEFGLPDGGDSAMALAFPRARAVSVGDASARRLPPGVHRLAEKAGRGAARVLRAVLGL